MRKIISIVLLGSVLSCVSVSAKAQNDIVASKVASNHVATLQQSDADFLFKDIETNKVAVLDTEEMKETKGEFWGAFAAIVSGLGLLYQIGQDHGWWAFKFN